MKEYPENRENLKTEFECIRNKYSRAYNRVAEAEHKHKVYLTFLVLLLEAFSVTIFLGLNLIADKINPKNNNENNKKEDRINVFGSFVLPSEIKHIILNKKHGNENEASVSVHISGGDILYSGYMDIDIAKRELDRINLIAH